MNLTLVKVGTVKDFFQAMCNGMIAQDEDGHYYRMQSKKLEESLDLQKWMETNEFVFGTINGIWKIYK